VSTINIANQHTTFQACTIQSHNTFPWFHTSTRHHITNPLSNTRLIRPHRAGNVMFPTPLAVALESGRNLPVDHIRLVRRICSKLSTTRSSFAKLVRNSFISKRRIQS